MSKNNRYSHRGSNSEHASYYKNKGHSDEDDFALLIDGEVKKGTQKTDVKGPDGTTYSVKGGGKHWQICLYSSGNFKDNQWGELGPLFEDCLNCFTNDYSRYEKDKFKAKDLIYRYIQEKSGEEVYDHKSAINLDPEIKKKISQKMRDNTDLLKGLIGEDNSYLNSKLKLPVVTKKMKEKFSEEYQIRTFLEKGIFNKDEVDKLVVREEENFLIFDKKDVLDIFEESLEAENSIAGRGIDDINIGGQKTILKHKTNICELEIRNDSIKHYRQVRFNMKRKQALILFNQKCTERYSFAPKVIYCKKA